MLAKLTRGNQLTIPKEIIRLAGLKEGNDYLDVVYENGIIQLKPVEIEERIPSSVYENLIESAFTVEDGDITAEEKEADILSKRRKKE